MNSRTNMSTNSTTNLTISSGEWRQRVETVIIFEVFAVFGVLFNALPILLTAFTQIRKNKVNIMVANLSSSGLILCTMFLIGAQPLYILYHDQISMIGCQWLGFIQFTMAMFEFIFPPVISINRYISLYHADKYERVYSARNIFFMVIGSWLFCMIVPLIFTLYGKTGFDYDNLHCCIIELEGTDTFWVVLYWVVIIVPLACTDGVMLFCNFKIYKKLSEHKDKANTLKDNVVNQNKEIMWFLLADMMFPIIFHTTYHVAKFVLPQRSGIFEKRIFMIFYLVNCCVRGGVTLTMLRPYRNGLKNIFKVIFCQGVNQNAVAPSTSTKSGATNNTLKTAQASSLAPAPEPEAEKA